MIPFNDISENNGAYNMDVDQNPAVAIRMSTGELMRFDHEASRNYTNAIRTGKVPILYHYAGGNDPVQEAELFLAAVAPLAEGDIYCLDAELGQSREWKQAFIDHIRSKTNNTNPWDYMNISTTNSLGGPIDDCALWLAAPSWGFNETIPLDGNWPIMAQQGPIVNGHDTNMFFGPIEALKAYAYKNNEAPAPLVPNPEPTPDPTPQPQPSPLPITPPTPVPEPNPTPIPSPTPAPTPDIEVQNNTLLKQILTIVKSIKGLLLNLFKRGKQ